MELALKACWLALAAVHAMPAAVLVQPSLLKRLYGVAGDGPAGALLTHRGALFLAVLAVALLVAFDPGARRAASLVVAISVVGFLAVYASAGLPAGPLRDIAVVDAIALLPLAAIVVAAWRS